MYNNELCDIMDSVNNIAKGSGFKNGIDWAERAKRADEISYEQYKIFSNVHDLRIRIAHGNARDIVVSGRTLQEAEQFLRKIKISSLAKGKVTYRIPDGGFRVQSFIKEFEWNGEDGNVYYFKFKIKYEYNYIDDGDGGMHANGYFIHILNAPYINHAFENLHTYHIISTNQGGHICWNKPIESFEEANAVMLVWVKRYTTLIVETLKNSSITESQLRKKADKKGILPAGTFRSRSRKCRNNNITKMPGNMKTIYIKNQVYNEIMRTIGSHEPELGGMLGWSEDQSIIDNYVFDYSADVTYVEYNPNIKELNKVLNGDWDKAGIYLAGFVHSHPGLRTLSFADIEYAMRIMDAFDMQYLFMPIIADIELGKPRMYPYIVHISGKVERCNMVITKDKDSIEENEKSGKLERFGEKDLGTFSSELLAQIEQGFSDMGSKTDSFRIVKTPNEQGENTFSRIDKCIDVDYMKKCTIIGVGCGGARSFYEDMARVGVGSFVLIDGDKSSKTNIASQNGYISDIGKYKTNAVKAKLLDVNDELNIESIPRMLDDDFSDKQLLEIISKYSKSNKDVLICSFTDDFLAQARTAKFAVDYGFPYLCSQHHEFGLTSEVVYWYPEVSQCTPQEVLKSRYEAYENGFVNNVTSAGSPIFNTTRLNALCEKIATGILCYANDKQNPYSSFLELKSCSNLLIIKQRQLMFTDSTFIDIFDNNGQSFFDEVMWINPLDM